MLLSFRIMADKPDTNYNIYFLIYFRDEGDKPENVLLEKQLNNGLREYQIVKPDYQNAKVSLPKHYYRNTKISRDNLYEGKDQMNKSSCKNEDHSNKIMKKVRLANRISFFWYLTNQLPIRL